ncbi:protein translocase subunit SecD [Candidatus Berkelbacteria bacterium CG_4_9_14_0_2_um_filter_42_30]|uniref:Protein translocase subunit SecD n=2 Tax=Candidatus Berkelbacteria TaxID=1618330 RepID=A0A2H0AZG4_9BACT|nr:MAG: protein translocase subunit SecD [Candidatus Berkelbacteria bacterium CG23_combo_of_CG06-09_8_20_14_all_41_73]PJC65756.1 MAG: protein translocase subunit SecD [Candidatus Berkelbacteria bacterium CG_4_9_14_0_2_um_filter_42_30]
MRRTWIIFVFIVIILALSIVIDIPKGPKIFGREIKTHLGLDLQGGTELIYQADLSKSDNKSKDLTNLMNIFRQRIDRLGVAEPAIQQQGSDQVLIQLPGVKDIGQAIATIGQTYELVFMTQATDQTTGAQLSDYYDQNYTYPGFWQPTDLTGSDLVKSDVTYENQNQGVGQSQPVVTLSFNNTGKEKFAKITKDNLKKQVAIILDNRIVSAPTVQSEITDGKAIITGQKDIKEAKKLADRLNEGMLPIPAKIIGQQNVGATLGSESVKKSLIAGIIGLILVGLFMIIHYRFPGFIAVIALGIYSLITLALFKTIPVTMTLAGIAGFILSIGMAVDANILIFERTREELRSGKDIAAAIEEGFRRAWNSIRDSNFSTIITCIILFYFGTGIIKGFALTLAIGVLVSMFTAITVSRNFLLILSHTSLRRFLHV